MGVYPHNMGPTTGGTPCGPLRGRRALLRMSGMNVPATFLAILVLAVSPAGAAPEGQKTAPEAPVKVAVAVSPEAVGAGSDAAVTVRLEPKPGIKMNKYPKIKVQVPAVAGLVDEAEQSLGNSAAPPLDQLDTNYFHGGVDPLELKLHLDPQATKGRHEIRAKLSYFYCVAASGYCAPARTELAIPVTIR